MRPGADFAAVLRLDFAEVVRSRWLGASLALYAALAAIFVAAGLRESGVFGFTGLGRVLFSLCHTMVLILPLIALVATGQVVNRARDDGTLELLMSQPIRRDRYLLALLAVRFGALALPLLVLFALLGLAGSVIADAGAAAIAARASALCASLLFAFTAFGLLISVRVRSPARANAYVILCWLAGAALVDFALIGAMLRWHLQPRAVLLLAALNPVQDTRLALLSAGGVDLETLGPVGFYLIQTLGAKGLLALGVGWPVALGAAAAIGALRAFRRGDLV